MHPNIPMRQKRGKIHTADVHDDYYDETSSLYWESWAQYTVHNHLRKAREHNTNKAKNVIFFLGDGMSIATLAAARTYLGQRQGKTGEETRLSFEEFPYVGLSKTYCIDKQVPDSACTATAYLCGVKGNFQTIGCNGRVELNDCKAANTTVNQVQSLMALAQRAGKATGFVTTTTVTHASPAGNYAHTSNRGFECDSDVTYEGLDPNECQDIASQLVYNKPGDKIKVVFGGGRAKFLPKTTTDFDGYEGERADGKDLIEEWKKGKPNAKVLYDKRDFDSLDIENTDFALGLFAPSHLDFNLDADRTKQPSLLEMTEAAIEILQKDENGFFLFVEGGRIDHGHHNAQVIKALDETVEFSNAIKRAVEMTDHDNTLIVVTSDHAHTMTIAGYPDRGNPITGLNSMLSDVDNLPSLTLSYANGPGFGIYQTQNGVRNITEIKIDKNTIYPGSYPTLRETHGGDDVGVFALGCFSHLFSGVYEQNTIPHLISYAACYGDGITVCVPE
ncbi:membrane-bound alkaline phosphatase isoform X2 [Sitodiplosis mosellana]|nr:membrane-bound alkaline phosphatase isoform X2 [Sitodiplosis mosellana]